MTNEVLGPEGSRLGCDKSGEGPPPFLRAGKEVRTSSQTFVCHSKAFQREKGINV